MPFSSVAGISYCSNVTPRAYRSVTLLCVLLQYTACHATNSGLAGHLCTQAFLLLAQFRGELGPKLVCLIDLPDFNF